MRITPITFIAVGRVFGGPLAGPGMAEDGIGDGEGMVGGQNGTEVGEGMDPGAAGGMVVVAFMAAGMVEAGTANRQIL